MRSLHFTALLGAVLLSLSCSDDKQGAPSDDDQKDNVPLGIAERTLRVTTGKYSVPPGDHFECFYTDLKTDKELFVNGTYGSQGQGGHHITIYYATAPQPAGHHKCDDLEMTQWRQVGGTGANTEGVVDLPPGVAVKVPAGQQIVIQTHYINAGGKDREVEDDITVRLLPPADVKIFANAYVAVDTKFKIPPRADGVARTTTCTLESDLQIITMLGHMHEWGKHYKLERLDDKGTVVDTLIDHDWDPSYATHPPTKRWPTESPLMLAKGTRLRQTCTWNNDTAEEMTFPREMCVLFTWYLEDKGFLQCGAEADEAVQK
jgi:hypothetical protein